MPAQTALATGAPCAHVPHEDHPKVVLTNGQLDVVIFLPDAKNGYYRGSRFDWSGLIACASFAGHRFFGEWTDGYDPLRNDAVVGPVEEFRAPDGLELGYTDAAVGGSFVKPGVGVLRRIDDGPYRFGAPYPLLDGGAWTVKVHKRSIDFTQRLTTPLGFAYEYTKKLEIDGRKPVLRLKHTFKNLGRKPITTAVYDHDFFIFDDGPVSQNMSVLLGFTPVAPKSLGTAAELRGDTVAFTATPSRTETAQGYLEGYKGRPGEYRIEVRDRGTGTRVVQSSPSPISRFYLWSTKKTICPEAYLSLDVAPQHQQRWEIRYEFAATP